ncbi:MAG TPA: PilZ domain-containing protein [Polyangiaceae bacterium]
MLGRERRRAPRVAADKPVEIEIVGGGRSRAWAADISMGGMSLLTSEVPRHGSFLLVGLGQPVTPFAIRVPATVRWTRRCRFGIQFVLLGVRETSVLLAFVNAKLRAAAADSGSGEGTSR